MRQPKLTCSKMAFAIIQFLRLPARYRFFPEYAWYRYLVSTEFTQGRACGGLATIESDGLRSLVRTVFDNVKGP